MEGRDSFKELQIGMDENFFYGDSMGNGQHFIHAMQYISVFLCCIQKFWTNNKEICKNYKEGKEIKNAILKNNAA
jgi:hypothetical protein